LWKEFNDCFTFGNNESEIGVMIFTINRE
jgi:hypothetical protein